MSARARVARRLATGLSATVLLLLLVLAWDLRPALPPLPHSFSQPLLGGTISAVLDVAAWAVAVMLDLVLLARVIQFGRRKTPSRAELRLRRAFAQRSRTSRAPSGDWRVHAAPLTPPVLRLPMRRESEPQHPSPQLQHHDLDEPLTLVEAVRDAHNERPALLLLGPLELSGCKKRQPRRRATAELITYLAMQRRRVSRDELLEALWPGDDPRRSAARFYQAVSEARKLLGEAFERDHDTYALDRERLQVDVDELDWLRSQVEATMGHERVVLLERAIALFRGEPLAGTGALWAESEQRRLTACRLDLLEQVGRLRLEANDSTGALHAAEQAIAVDGENERIVRLAMEAEASLGRREAVNGRYERLRHDLGERFGLEPDRETRSLYRRLLGQDADAAAQSSEQATQMSAP